MQYNNSVHYLIKKKIYINMHVVLTHEKNHRINYFYLIRHVIYYQFNQNSHLLLSKLREMSWHGHYASPDTTMLKQFSQEKAIIE